MAREIVEAVTEAKRRRAAAEAEAESLVAAARAAAAAVTDEARAAGLRAATAELAARELAIRVREEGLAETSLERSITLARALAERLLGEELVLAPERITALAREALREAAGARRANVAANPADAPLLQTALAELDRSGRAVSVSVDPGLPRGSVRIRTELGELDASLGAELDRLVVHLRESLAP